MYKKIAGTFGIKVITAIFNLAIIVLLSRTIGAAGKGQASLIVASMAMVLLFCNMIGGASLIYFVPRYSTFLLFLFSNLWSIIVALLGLGFMYLFPDLPQELIVHVIGLSLLNSFLATNLSILLGKEKIMTNNYIALLQTLLTFIVVCVLTLGMNNLEVYSYIYALYIAMGVCLAVSFVFIVPYFTNFSFTNSKNLLVELARLGVTNQSAHVIQFLTFRLNYYLLAVYSGDATVGVYSNGVSLIESLLLISNSFAAVLYPKVANSTDIQHSRSITVQMTKLSVIICLMALIPLLLLPTQFWVWLFGSEFNGVREVIWVLAPGIVFYNIVLIIGHYFSGSGKYKYNLLAYGSGLVIALIMSLFVLPNYGIYQAAVISTCSYLVISMVIMYVFAKEANLKLWQLLPSKSDFVWIKNQVQNYLK